MTRTAERVPAVTAAQRLAAAHRLTTGQRDKLRARLEKDRLETEELIRQLGGEIESLTKQRASSQTDDEHDPEGPTLAFERSRSMSTLGYSKGRLAHIDSALARLDTRAFGACADCDTKIPFARLEARPFSPYCVTCAERHSA